MNIGHRTFIYSEIDNSVALNQDFFSFGYLSSESFSLFRLSVLIWLDFSL